MQILDIMTRPIGTNKKNKTLSFFVITASWIFMVIIATMISLKTESVKVVMPIMVLLAVQMVVCYSYTECRIAIVKKELLKEQEEIRFTLKAMQQAKNV